MNTAENKQVTLYRIDTIMNKTDGDLNGYRIGVYKPSSAQKQVVKPLIFLGNSLYTVDDLDQLMQDESMKTLGVDQATHTSIKNIPNFPGNYKLVIYKLEDLRNLTDTVESTYYLEGISSQDYQSLIIEIAHKIGNDDRLLTTKPSWTTSDSFSYQIIFFALIISSNITDYFYDDFCHDSVSKTR